jgi:ketosteroid isomerase-like protein
VTSEALAVVRKFFEMSAAGDETGVSETLDPNVVWFGTRGGLDEAQVLRGPDAALAYLREIEEPWERYDFEVERLVEAGDTVVAFVRERAKARHGGLEVYEDVASLFKVRERKIVEMRGYIDREEALRTAGLTDQP